MTKDEALKLALEALNSGVDAQVGRVVWTEYDSCLIAEAIKAIKETLAQPAQEPVAYFDWMPKGATHITQIKVKTKSGGKLEMGAYVFKYDNEVLMVYTTDNDNEYPGWREAKECFYHLNFPVSPIPTTPPAAELVHEYRKGFIAGQIDMRDRPDEQRTWVGLTDDEFDACWNNLFGTGNYNRRNVYQAIEAKLKEKNFD
jgi:hypothetical protein